MVKRAFRILMDVLEFAALKVGYSYRRVDDVENLPLETQTALLDARCITGNFGLCDKFGLALRQAIVPAAFVTGHIDTRRGLGASAEPLFVVEPNVKEGHGGLRDLHAARWISQVAFGLSGEMVWNSLRSRGILSDAEIEASHDAIEFMCKTRNALHLVAGRGLDVLGVERHSQVAERLGYASVSEFIPHYYSCAHQIWRIYRKVADATRQVNLEIEPG